MPRAWMSVPSRSSRSWLLAEPQMILTLNRGIVSALMIPPSAQGQKMSAGWAAISSGGAAVTEYPFVIVSTFSPSMSLTTTRAPALTRRGTTSDPTAPSPWTVTVRPSRESVS